VYPSYRVMAPASVENWLGDRRVAHSFLGRDSVASCRRLGRIISHRAEAKGEGANLGVPHASLSLRGARAAEGKYGAPKGTILELFWAISWEP
jgi:hypothetical protein